MTLAAYKELEQRFRRLSALHDAEAVLHWDHAVMMPTGGAAARAEQLAALQVLRHELIAAPEPAALLDRAEGEIAELDPWQAANLDCMRRNWRHATAVPKDLVERLSRATSASEMAWRAAREADDFAALAPHLEEVVGLVREVAAAKAEAFGTTPYDALLDAYEPGLRAATIDPLFDQLEGFLPSFLAQTLARQAEAPPLVPEGPFPVEAQRALGRELMSRLGFDFEHGRLDESHHPFTGGVPDDVRITTRYTVSNFSEALMAVLHECGHALYERGLPAAWRGQPVGTARGMVVHESQSLVVEMQACRGPQFLAYLAPRLRQAFDGDGAAWEADNLRRLSQRVERGLIRVDADEVSYPLHIILRYRLEQALLAGELEVAELPAAWAEGMKRLLGVVPPDDRDGCLQDIHWPGGDFGYFPTYTLGAIAAAQLFDAAKAAVPDILPGLERGDFAPLMGWLAENVHALGSLLPLEDLLVRATGRGLDVATFERHLTRRYGP
jgi:carboxypeptidase Taq